jgi:chemotaxis protein histidine kinase CheA
MTTPQPHPLVLVWFLREALALLDRAEGALARAVDASAGVELAEPLAELVDATSRVAAPRLAQRAGDLAETLLAWSDSGGELPDDARELIAGELAGLREMVTSLTPETGESAEAGRADEVGEAAGESASESADEAGAESVDDSAGEPAASTDDALVDLEAMSAALDALIDEQDDAEAAADGAAETPATLDESTQVESDSNEPGALESDAHESDSIEAEPSESLPAESADVRPDPTDSGAEEFSLDEPSADEVGVHEPGAGESDPAADVEVEPAAGEVASDAALFEEEATAEAAAAAEPANADEFDLSALCAAIDDLQSAEGSASATGAAADGDADAAPAGEAMTREQFQDLVREVETVLAGEEEEVFPTPPPPPTVSAGGTASGGLSTEFGSGVSNGASEDAGGDAGNETGHDTGSVDTVGEAHRDAAEVEHDAADQAEADAGVIDPTLVNSEAIGDDVVAIENAAAVEHGEEAPADDTIASLGADDAFVAAGSDEASDELDATDAVASIEAATLPAAEPVAESVAEPGEAVVDPSSELIAEAGDDLADAPGLGSPDGDAVAATADGAAGEPADEAAPEPVVDPVAEPLVEPINEPIAQSPDDVGFEPMAEAVAESPADVAADAADTGDAAGGIDLADNADAGAPAPPTEPQCSSEAGGMDPEMLAATFHGGPILLEPEQVLAIASVGGGDAAAGGDADGGDWGARPINLPPEKLELVQFMVTDLRDSIFKLEPLVGELADFSRRLDAAEQIVSLAQEMRKASSFFEFLSLDKVLDMLIRVGSGIGSAPDATFDEIHLRTKALASLLDQHASGLQVGMEIRWPLDTLESRLSKLMVGRPLHPTLREWHQNDVDRVLELDGVVEGVDSPPSEADLGEFDEAAAPPPAAGAANSGGGASGSSSSSASTSSGAASEQTIRVSKSAVEQLLDVVRQLVLAKNRVSAQSRGLAARLQDEEARDLVASGDELGRLMGLLQASVTDIRTQAIDKLFERYHRVIQDVANINDKQIELEIRGGDTPVDKFLLERLGEPLMRILRHAASGSIEKPEQREAAGKPTIGRITLTARNEAGRLLVTIVDDGVGFDADEIGMMAEAADLVSESELASMPSDEIVALVMRDDFPDGSLGGLRTMIEAFGGSITLESQPGRGATFRMAMPIVSAVIPSMMVEIGGELYAVPLESIVEIVRIDAERTHDVSGHPVMRLRDQVLPLVMMREALALPQDPEAGRIAVVVNVAGEDAALAVDGIVGQAEVVVESLDKTAGESGPFAGATIREDGLVSLILDVGALMRKVPGAARRAAAELVEDPDALPSVHTTTNANADASTPAG